MVTGWTDMDHELTEPNLGVMHSGGVYDGALPLVILYLTDPSSGSYASRYEGTIGSCQIAQVAGTETFGNNYTGYVWYGWCPMVLMQ